MSEELSKVQIDNATMIHNIIKESQPAILKQEKKAVNTISLVLNHCIFDPSHGNGADVSINITVSGHIEYNCTDPHCRNKTWQDILSKIKRMTTTPKNSSNPTQSSRTQILVEKNSQFGSGKWDDIEHFIPEDQNRLPHFDPNWLNGEFSNYVTALATSLDQSIDMTAMAALSAFSGAVQKKFAVNVRADWTEPLPLWTITVGDPASHKSQVCGALQKPFFEYERELNDQLRDEIKKNNRQRDKIERHIKSLESQQFSVSVKAANKPTDNDIQELYAELDNIPQTTEVQLIAGDVTTEKLCDLLNDNQERIAIFQDEGALLSNIGGYYTDGNARSELYNDAYTGSSYSYSRKNSGTLTLDSPLVSMTIFVQPEIIRKKLIKNDTLMLNGFGCRFAYIQTSPITINPAEPPAIPERAKTAYRNTIRKFLDIDIPSEPELLTLSDTAKEIFLRFERQELVDLRTEKPPELTSWLARAHGQAIRIAGLLHLLERKTDSDTVISVDIMVRAIEIERYLYEHAEYMFNHYGSSATQEEKDALYILGKLKPFIRNGQYQIKERDLRQKIRDKRSLDTSAKQNSGLEELIIRNFIRFGKVGNTKTVEVNPDIKAVLDD